MVCSSFLYKLSESQSALLPPAAQNYTGNVIVLFTFPVQKVGTTRPLLIAI